MILKILLKIWPSLVPIISYILWVFIIRPLIFRILSKKMGLIEAEYEILDPKTGKKILEKKSDFSLNNQVFITIIYLSLIFMIFSFLYFALAPK